MAQALTKQQTVVISALWFAGVVLLATAGWFVYRPVLGQRYQTRGEVALAALRQEEATAAFARAASYGAEVSLLQTYRVHDPRAFSDLIARHGSPQLQQKLTEALREGDPAELITRASALAADGYTALAQYPLQAAVSQNPELPQAHHALARIYDALGQPELAANARKNRDQLTKRYLWEEQGLLNSDGTLR